MFFENDRTYCGNTECKHTECYRHQANIVGKPRFISIADFDGTKECKKGTNNGSGTEHKSDDTSDLVDKIFNEITTAITEAKEESSKFEYECFETLLTKKVENIRKKYTEGANESHIS